MANNRRRPTTPITRDQLMRADKGQIIMDALGNTWEIVDKTREVGPNLEVRVSYNNGQPETITWANEQILDDRKVIILELNLPTARIV